MAADDRIAAAAGLLIEARRARRALDGLGAAAPAGIEEAYAVQAATHPGILSLAGGGRRVGWKIGCTNPTAQAQLGITAPFYGALLSPFVYATPAQVPAQRFFMHVLEPEIAFRLGRDLPAAGAPYDLETVAAAVEAAMPAIEIVDSRYRDWTRAGALLLIADNGSNGGWVHGEPRRDVDLMALDEAGVEIVLDGAVRERGRGGNALGHPLNALTWLANELARRGEDLKAGELVSTGTCTVVVPAGLGAHAVVRVARLGEAELRLT